MKKVIILILILIVSTACGKDKDLGPNVPKSSEDIHILEDKKDSYKVNKEGTTIGDRWK